MLESERELAELMRRGEAGSAPRAARADLAGGASECAAEMLAAVERLSAAVERELSTPRA